MTTESPTDAVLALLARLAAVERRLAELAARETRPDALTAPDEATGERWEAGQAWAHLAEFPAYWLEQMRTVVAGYHPGAGEPVAFGRVKTDAGRLAAIERDRATDRAALMGRVAAGIDAVTSEVRSLPAEAWEARGVHPTLGEMSLGRILERFVIGHLEEHADQLDGLARNGAT